MILAAAAVWGAYQIFVLEGRRDKKKEQNQKDNERLDKLNYFSILANDAFTVSAQQKENIIRLADTIAADPVNFHPMHQVPMDVMRRIKEDLNLEEYLLAYAEQFHEIRKRAVGEFQEIISSIDYLYSQFSLMIIEHERTIDFDSKRKDNYQKLFYDTHTLVSNLYLSLPATDKFAMKQLEIALNPFLQAGKGRNFDLQFFYKTFFVPLNTFCINYLAKRENPLPEIVQLATWTRDGVQAFDEIKSQNMYFREGLLVQYELIQNELLTLLFAKRRLTANF